MNNKLEMVLAAADRFPGGRKRAAAVAAGVLVLLLAVMLWPGGKPTLYKMGEQCPGKPPAYKVGSRVLEGEKVMGVMADCSLKEASAITPADMQALGIKPRASEEGGILWPLLKHLFALWWDDVPWWGKIVTGPPLLGLTLGVLISIPFIVVLLLVSWPLLPVTIPAMMVASMANMLIRWPLKFLGGFLSVGRSWDELKHFWAQAKAFWFRLRRKPVPHKALADLGSAGFAKPAEAFAAADLSVGAPVDLGDAFGRQSDEAAKSGAPASLRFKLQKHVLMIAGTRGGKGVSYIIPNLLTYDGGVFVLDPKGENARATYRTRANKGKVVVLDPFAASRVPASGFNPLTQLAGDSMPTEAAALASALVMSYGDGKESHWSDNARNVLQMLILHVATAAKPEQRDLVTVRRLLIGNFLPEVERDDKGKPEGKGGKPAAGAKPADKAGEPSGKTAPAPGSEEKKAEEEKPAKPVSTLEGMMKNLAFGGIIAEWARGFLVTPSDERGSILSTARTHTAFLDDPAMRRSLAAPNHAADFSAWERGEALSVFVCLPLPYFATFARWLRVVTHAGLNRLLTQQNPPEKPVQFYLDELATLGHFEVVEKAVGLAAGYGVQVWSVFQDWSQVERCYGKAAPTFWNNAGVRIVFGVSDTTTCELVSKATGVTTVETSSLAGVVGAFAQSRGTAAASRPLLTHDEIALKYAPKPDGSGLGLVFLDGLRPLEVEKLPYFKNAALEGLWDDPRL